RARWRLGGSLAALDMRRVARMQTVPALLLHGTQDKEVPVAHSSAVAAAWPGATLVRLEGLGHTRLLADTAVITRAVDFVTGAPGTPASLPHSA
ncbi:MAG TPA: alpha/beta hydrolase, partial [bacterium]|nr:alpha/beta hydrolase [bacterium]